MPSRGPRSTTARRVFWRNNTVGLRITSRFAQTLEPFGSLALPSHANMNSTGLLHLPRSKAAVAEATGAGATAAAALATLAVGSLTIGLVVISRIIIRELLIKQVHLRKLKIDQLDVEDLRVNNLVVLKEQKPPSSTPS